MERQFAAQEMSQDALLEHGVGRKVVAAGAAPDFSRVPFAGQIGDWFVPGESFLWVQFDDGSFWLIGPRVGEQRYFYVRAAHGEEAA